MCGQWVGIDVRGLHWIEQQLPSVDEVLYLVLQVGGMCLENALGNPCEIHSESLGLGFGTL